MLFWNALHRYCLPEGYQGLHSTLTEAEELLEMFLFGVIDSLAAMPTPPP